MTQQERDLIGRFRWLCHELIAGNEFSSAQLSKWAFESNSALNKDDEGAPKTVRIHSTGQPYIER